MLSRSCPYLCTFCYHIKGAPYRAKSLDYIFKELDYYYENYGNMIKSLDIADDLFNVNKERVLEFCKRIKKYGLPFGVQTRVDTMDEEMLIALKDAGAILLSYGLESASNRVLKSMKKNITIEQATSVFELSRKHNFVIQANLILGDIEDDESTVREDIDYFTKYNSEFDMNMGMIGIYPSTYLYKYALSKGIIIDELQFLEDGCPPINVTKLTNEKYSLLSDMCASLQSVKDIRNRKPVSTWFPQINVHKDGTIIITLYCNQCYEKITYTLKDTDLLTTNQFVLCKKCNRRLDFRLSKLLSLSIEQGKLYRLLLKSFFGKYQGKRIAIWGMNNMVRTMLIYSQDLRNSVVRIVDKNFIGLAEESYCGLKVEDPDVLQEVDFDVLLTPVASRLSQLENKLHGWGKQVEICSISAET